MTEVFVTINELERVQPDDSLVGVVFGTSDPRSPWIIVAHHDGFVEAVSLVTTITTDVRIPPVRFSVNTRVRVRNSRLWLTKLVPGTIEAALRERFGLEVTKIFQN